MLILERMTIGDRAASAQDRREVADRGHALGAGLTDPRGEGVGGGFREVGGSSFGHIDSAESERAALAGAQDAHRDIPVGVVASTSDVTPLLWHVAVGEDQYVQLDDVLVARRVLPTGEVVTTSGVVTQVSGRHEGATFASDTFLIRSGSLPARHQEVAEVMTTRVEPELYVPPQPGADTWRTTGADRDRALYFDSMKRKVVCGSGRDGQPIFVDLDFIDGTRGAHVSISGIPVRRAADQSRERTRWRPDRRGRRRTASRTCGPRICRR